jgi:inositol transport system ATP-binding protein
MQAELRFGFLLTMNPAAKLKVEDIEKSFPGVKALDHVTLAVKPATVHAICGENGAGKSTLMKVILGILQPDSGAILIDGKAVRINNPIEARRHGISMIFQELNYIPEMTVEESFFLGNWPSGRFGKVNWQAIRSRAAEMLASENLRYSPQTKLKDLTVSDIQMLEIVKAISYNSDIIIMDEPTSALTSHEAGLLFSKIGELKKRNKSILYVSHKMDEIFNLADQITVLRDGRVIDSRPREGYDPESLITQMVGRPLGTMERREQPETGEELLRVEGLSRHGKFHNINFQVRAGEIVGFAGLMGAGRTEVMRAVVGLDSTDSGYIRIKGELAPIAGVADSIRKGLLMLSEDRRRYGIIPVRSVRENVTLSVLKEFIFRGRLHAQEEIRTARDYCDSLSIKCPGIETAIAMLSGGNQQKALLARSLLANPAILLLDEPTRGIDVAAKQEIYKIMKALAAQKKAVVLVSSELPELLLLCDRIYVMAKGAITGMLQGASMTQENIMAYALGANLQVAAKPGYEQRN